MRLYLVCKFAKVDQVTVQLEISRRERKKQATRQSLHDAAFALVEEQGLAAVTIEAIADRADVATRTFFNYFSSKEEAVLDRDPNRPEALRQALLARPPSEDALTALRLVMEQLVAQEILDGEQLLRRMLLIRSEPLLRGAMAAMHDEMEEALVEAVARRTGQDPGADLYPALVVSAGWGAFKVALLRWSDEGGRVPFDHLLTAAFDMLAVGLADPRARRP
jgi:AcrR family transcriptional regulator